MSNEKFYVIGFVAVMLFLYLVAVGIDTHSRTIKHREAIEAMQNGYVQKPIDREPWVIWVKDDSEQQKIE